MPHRRPVTGRGQAADIADIDGYGNLILLCRKHHKQVDDQRSHFTVARLKKIKREHAEREASRDASGPIRLIPDPARPAPEDLTLCLTGEDLWQAASGAYSSRSSYPPGLTDDQADAVDGLLDELHAWLLGADVMSHREQRQAARSLGEHIMRLAGLGLFVGTRTRHLLLTGGPAEPSPWRCFDIQFQRIREAELAVADRTPVCGQSCDGTPLAKAWQEMQPIGNPGLRQCRRIDPSRAPGTSAPGSEGASSGSAGVIGTLPGRLAFHATGGGTQ